MNWKILPCLFVLGAVAAGCASVNVSRVAYDDQGTEGFRYWLPKPYLQVSQPVELFGHQSVWRLAGGRLERVCDCETCNCDVAVPTADPRPNERRREMVDRGDLVVLPGAETGNDSGGGSGGGGSSGTPASKKTTPTPASSPSGGIRVTWLPDYCQMYAVSIRPGLGSNNTTLSLADGWQLTSVSAELDNTQLVESFVSLAETFLTQRAEVEVAEIEAAGETLADTGALETLAAPEVAYLVRTQTTYLRPGLYSLVKQDSCAQPPQLVGAETFFGLGTEEERVVQSTEWSVLKLE